MATAELPRSMNEANERDPFNNNCYGTLVDRPYLEVTLPVLDVHEFNERVIRGYEEGKGEKELPADLALARSLVPAGTAALRDFSYVAPEIPEYIRENCTGCMDCVTECPDTAILGKVIAEPEFEERLAAISNEEDRQEFEAQWSKTRKYYDGPQKKGLPGGRFAIIIDPSKCKGCAECVTVCDDNALKMIPKTEPVMDRIRKSHRMFKQVGPSDERYINEQSAHRHDAEGADARVRGRGGFMCGLRRGNGAADDVRGDGGEIWRPVGDRGGDGLQYGVYIDVSVQSVFGAVDEFAVRKRAGRRDGRAGAVGPDGLARQAAVVHRRRRGVF